MKYIITLLTSYCSMFFLFLALMLSFSANANHEENLNKSSLYHIANQLDGHIQFLKKIHKSYSATYPHHDNPKTDIIQPNFEHPAISWCARQIGANKSLEPLFDLWDDFEIYQGLDSNEDEIFLRSCCHLLFIIYNNMLCHISNECSSSYGSFRVSLIDVRDLYVAIASLPLAKFVILLNKIVISLTSELYSHSEQSDGSIFGWVKQNWWIPPVVIAGVITSLVLGKEGLLENLK